MFTSASATASLEPPRLQYCISYGELGAGDVRPGGSSPRGPG
jgi:hypothetical protein